MLPPLLPQEACCITTLLTVHTGGKGCSPYGLHVDVTKEPLAGMTPRAVAEASPGASGQRGTSPTLQIVLRGPVLGDGAHKGFLSAVRVLPSQAVRLDLGAHLRCVVTRLSHVLFPHSWQGHPAEVRGGVGEHVLSGRSNSGLLAKACRAGSKARWLPHKAMEMEQRRARFSPVLTLLPRGAGKKHLMLQRSGSRVSVSGSRACMPRSHSHCTA